MCTLLHTCDQDCDEWVGYDDYRRSFPRIVADCRGFLPCRNNGALHRHIPVPYVRQALRPCWSPAIAPSSLDLKDPGDLLKKQRGRKDKEFC
ncbi:unnamed protein product [Urochloa humidicola]